MDPGAHVEVVIFEMAGQQYALDIHLAREIVEMMPITPIPRSPPHITGIINLRGEITTILNLYRLLGLPDPGTEVGQKIVVLVPEAAEGSNVGIIVDNVHSVNQIPAHRIELKGKGSSADYTGFVRGIIRQERVEGEEGHKNLVIWIDMPAILQGLITQSS
ncbi:MAG TPA: chemotaxis protein CheW [Methanoregulaceae archaeon]|nr:chemotaxis protein CheW [Methanoregulaceae archaeon]HQJ88040.1 chemotaxis protein CheW [Methanoregulaceae archaeon]